MAPRQLAAADCCVMTNIAELVVRQLEKDHMLHLQRQVLPLCNVPPVLLDLPHPT